MAGNTDNAQRGMLGVHLVAAEFIRRGFIVAPTSTGAFGADLLVTDTECRKAWSIQVKTRTAPLFRQFLVGATAKTNTSPNLIYVFVSFKSNEPVFLVVPSRVVAKHVHLVGGMHVFDPHDAHGTKGWRIFGLTPRWVLPFKSGAPKMV
jgi:hypothetical protein